MAKTLAERLSEAKNAAKVTKPKKDTKAKKDSQGQRLTKAKW